MSIDSCQNVGSNRESTPQSPHDRPKRVPLQRSIPQIRWIVTPVSRGVTPKVLALASSVTLVHNEGLNIRLDHLTLCYRTLVVLNAGH